MNKKRTQKKISLPEIKIEISTAYGAKMKPEISLLHQQFKKGNWQPLKNQKISHVAIPKL